MPSLADQVHSEITACIGCHDCLLACPLPEASLIGIAELNAAVHLPVIRSENVVRFLTACTQCRQCVPVCPADLSRADMVLFNKIKIEDMIPDHVLSLQVGREVIPAPFTLDALAAELAGLRVFAGVPPADLRRLLLKVTLRKLDAGEVLCREGEFHERLYVVISGALEQTSDRGGARVRILVLGPGSFFGEMAIMADQPEPFSVTARVTSIVVEAPKAAVHRLMAAAPAFEDTMQSLYGRRAIYAYFERPSALGGLPRGALDLLLASAELLPRKAGQTLFRQGDPPGDAYLVKSGFLRVTRRTPPAAEDEVLVYFREGDLFGALPILLGEPAHAFSVQAVSRVELIRIPGEALRRALDASPGARALWTAGALEAERGARAQGSSLSRLASPRAEGSVPSRASDNASVALPLSWDALVEEGLAQGREILVVDQTRCTHCNACIDACGRRHGESRLELRGLSRDTLLFPTACRHCDDPVCLLCSVGGIVRRPSGEIAIVEDNCIGCGACAERCPYGNIRMHPVDPPKRGLWASFLDFLRGPPREAPPGALDPKVPQKAVKCDLCAGHDDYACVTACPVGAAFRIDPAEAFAAGDVFARARG